MAFIDDQQRVFRQIFEQRRWWLARAASRKIARIILDSGAGPGGLDHLDIELCPLLDALRLEQFALFGEFADAALQFGADQFCGLLQCRARRHIVRIGKNGDLFQRLRFFTGQRINLENILDLVTKQRDAPGPVFKVGRKQLYIVAAHAKGTAHEIGVVAPVLQLGKAAQDGLPLNPFTA